MSAYLKRLHVHLATNKKSFVDNGKYLKAKTQAIEALKHILSKELLYLISHCDFAFTVWNTLTSIKEQASNNLERDHIGDESDEACYIVQENDSLEIT